jgi:ABC-type multidrug transport system fused ATPase/permease subunit
MKSIAPADADPDPRPGTGFIARRGSVRFEKVTFAYPGGERVLNEFSVDVPGGSSLGIVGVSGAGKTTIVNLLCGFYQPDSGAIAIDGRDIRTIADEEVWRSLSVVTQEPQLFNRSVSGKTSPTVARIRRTPRFRRRSPEQRPQSLSRVYPTQLDGMA